MVVDGFAQAGLLKFNGRLFNFDELVKSLL